MKKWICLLFCIIMLPLPNAWAAKGEETEVKSKYERILQTETEYIQSLALENGSIPMTKLEVGDFSGFSFPVVDGISPEEYLLWPCGKIMPYFSSFACMGILRASRALGTEDGRQTALRFLDWYISHMNTAESDINGHAGTVYDYFVFRSPQDGRIVEVTMHDAYASQYAENPSQNPHDYDSTDSYAAMGLELIAEYADTFDKTYPLSLRATVDQLTETLLSTWIDKIDLTIAKPNYEVCYLMDNCEVYRGLTAAKELYTDFFNDPQAAAQMDEASKKTANAILTTLWSDTANCFKAAAFPNGQPAYDTDLSVFYPQASCQLFPVLFDVLSPTDARAQDVYAAFTESFCQKGVAGRDWAACDLAEEAYPWCILSRAVIKMKDYNRLAQFIDAVDQKFIQTGHPSPYYNAEAGHLLITVSELYEEGLFLEANLNEDTAAAPSPEPSAKPSATPDVAGKTSQPTGQTEAETTASTAKANASHGWLVFGAAAAILAGAAILIAAKARKHRR